MDAISYTVARTELAKTIDRVNDNRESIIITRNGKASAVILSMAEFESLQETAYLLSSPKNAQRLYESITEVEAGGGVQVTDLLE